VEFENNLKGDLRKHIVTPKSLLGNLRVVDERIRSSSIYQDPDYIPFYYHLGKYISPKNVLVFGLGLGFSISCFLKTNKSVRNILAFEPKSKEYYSPRLGLSNVKDQYQGRLDYHSGHFLDEQLKNKWDLILFDFEAGYDDLRNCLDFLWDSLSLDGYFVIEKKPATTKAVDEFISATNRPFTSYPTRFDITILKK
jgi:predicted O-methyltransferase YrrM